MLDGMSRCSICGERLDPRQRNGREVRGWEHLRGRNAGGGLNALVARENTGRYACALCMSRLRDRVSSTQGELL
jgi:hypothetical protein